MRIDFEHLGGIDKGSIELREGLLVTENACHQIYHVNQFLP